MNQETDNISCVLKIENIHFISSINFLWILSKCESPHTENQWIRSMVTCKLDWSRKIKERDDIVWKDTAKTVRGLRQKISLLSSVKFT